MDIPSTDYDELCIAVKRLKNNKAPGANGIPTKLCKNGSQELIHRLYTLLCRIWANEYMPSKWNLSIVCTILKKADPIIWVNYRGISLLNISYKVLSSVSCERLKPIVNSVISAASDLANLQSTRYSHYTKFCIKP